MTRPVVIIFARIPRLGVGKRRLARDIGDRAALRASRNMLHTMLRRLRAMRGATRVLAATPDHHTRINAPGFIRITQGGGDLGTRMHNAIRHYPNRPVAIIGSDIPAIEAGDLRAAFRALRGCDAAFGPATDGGYWLVGLAGKRPSAPFARVRWSSEHALADTLENFYGRRIALLRPLDDLDTAPPERQQRPQDRPA